MATVLGLTRLERWRPSPIEYAALFLGTLCLYPVARSIILGQFTLHVTLFLVAALLALRRGRDGWAGVWLAASSVKPQMGIVVVLWLVCWAVGSRRWRVVGGLLMGGALMSLAAMALFPRWPLSFLEDVQRYSQVAGGRNPLSVLVMLVYPTGPEVIRYGLAGLLLAGMLGAFRRGWRRDEPLLLLATHWAIVFSLLVPFQTGTTNQAMLLIPMFAWLCRALRRRGRWWTLIGGLVVLIGPWVLFLSTIKGNWENPLLFLPLPLLGLAILVCTEVQRWRLSRQKTVPPSYGDVC
jgi:hypothetical protein